MLNIPTAKEVQDKISSDAWITKVENAIKEMYDRGDKSTSIEGRIPKQLKDELEGQPYFYNVTYGCQKNEQYTTISSIKE